MHFLPLLQSLILLTLANGAPVVAKKLFGARFSHPLDGGARFFDGHPLFGPAKTIRGLVVALLATAAGAPLIGLSPGLGLAVGAIAMAGDLSSSFLKRRLDRPPSSRATGIDQIPESLFPLLACREALSLSFLDVAIATGAFFVGEILCSRLLYRIGLREKPY